MKLPKTVVICGREFKVIVNKKDRGGWFDTDKQQLCIGTQDASSDRIKEVFLHETIEAIFGARMVRYKLPYSGEDNGNYLFSFNHLEFENCIIDIAYALKDVI